MVIIIFDTDYSFRLIIFDKLSSVGESEWDSSMNNMHPQARRATSYLRTKTTRPTYSLSKMISTAKMAAMAVVEDGKHLEETRVAMPNRIRLVAMIAALMTTWEASLLCAELTSEDICR